MAEDALVVLRRHREIKKLVGTHAPLVVLPPQGLRKRTIPRGVFEHSLPVDEHTRKRIQRRALASHLCGNHAAHLIAKPTVGHRSPGEPDDLEKRRQKLLAMQVKKRRHELPACQIARDAEDDENRGVLCLIDIAHISYALAYTKNRSSAPAHRIIRHFPRRFALSRAPHKVPAVPVIQHGLPSPRYCPAQTRRYGPRAQS